MTKTTKTSQVTQSETLEEPAEEIKLERQPTEQPIAETSEPVETQQEQPVSEPSQPKTAESEDAEPAEEVSE